MSAALPSIAPDTLLQGRVVLASDGRGDPCLHVYDEAGRLLAVAYNLDPDGSIGSNFKGLLSEGRARLAAAGSAAGTMASWAEVVS